MSVVLLGLSCQSWVMRYAFLPLVILCGAAQAQTVMTAEEFDSYTRGKTFYYGRAGTAYGAEEYLPNRRVIWTFLDGQCQNGIWYEQDGLICFRYEEITQEQCWAFRATPDGGMSARFGDDPAELDLYEVEKTPEPLSCPGPDVGV